MPPSLKVPQYLELIGSSLSFCFNVFLFYLIHKFSRPEYGSYRLLMMAMTLLYVLFSAIELAVLPSYYIYEYNYLLFTTNFIEYQNLSQILITTFCAVFACIQLVLAFQFVYRYLSVANHNHLRYMFFTGKRHIVWMLTSILFFLNWFIVANLVFGNDVDAPKDLQLAVETTFGRNMSEMAFTLVTYAQPDEKGGLKLMTLKIGVMMYLLACAAVPMTISLVCGLKTWLRIRSATEITQKSLRLQKQERQLFFALIFQFTIPFLGNTVPMMILFSCPALHISTEPYTNYICMLIPFYPIFDATATICIIKDYYKGVMKLVGLSKYTQNSSMTLNLPEVPANSMYTQASGKGLSIQTT